MSQNKFDQNYPFCLFRIPKDGGRVIWEITNQCNYRCPYCIFSSTAVKPQNELDTARMKSVIDELHDLGFSHFKVSGGEPFIRKDLLEVLAHAKSKGFYIDLSSNASLITEERAAGLKNISVDMVHVSLDGHTKELQEAARGSGTFEPTIRGIKYLVKNGLYVRTGCLIFNKNDRRMEEIARYCAELGVNEIIFSLMEPVGRLKGDNSMMTERTPDELMREIEEIENELKTKIKVSHSFTEKPGKDCAGICPGTTKFLSIDNFGRVSPCTWVAERAPEYVSKNTLLSASLKAILNEKEITEYKKLVQRFADSGGGCPMRDLDAFQKIKK